MSDEPLPNSEIILYQTEDGRTRVQCRFEDETVWLTQKLMAELFQIGVGTVNHHLKAIFSEGELQAGATIRCYRIVQNEGARQITREVEHYNLDAILAVGFRVRSHRGTQFRQWAIGRLNEYLVKGFTMDDERLKNPPGKGQKDYFDEQLERIRDIRSSERRFYQKVLDIYATSVDYTPKHGGVAAVLRHGAEQDALGGARADGGGGDPCAGGRRKAFHGAANHAPRRHYPQGGRVHRQELPGW